MILTREEHDRLIHVAKTRAMAQVLQLERRPRLDAARLVGLVAWILPPRHRERYIHEWLAELDNLATGREKLVFAIRAGLRVVQVRVARTRSGEAGSTPAPSPQAMGVIGPILIDFGDGELWHQVEPGVWQRSDRNGRVIERREYE